MLYVDQPHVQIYYNRALNCTVHTWKGYFLEEEYQLAMSRCLELMVQTGARSLIVNLQAAMHEYWIENSWTATEWFSELVQTDLQKIAIVVREMDASAGNLYFYPVGSEKIVISRYFDRLEDAHDWIARKGI